MARGVKNPLANAGDACSIPHAREPLSPCTTIKPVLWSSGAMTTETGCSGVHAPQLEKPPQGEAYTPQLEKACTAMKMAEPKINKLNCIQLYINFFL